ncbi:trypsin-like serine peptidase [Halalkalicoccus salilacus]|uniref:trypsin-like serine peptidase n=1 Tax=Halalkalicoccus salilacus TaxID=3117459 RepID=UPI00300F7584
MTEQPNGEGSSTEGNTGSGDSGAAAATSDDGGNITSPIQPQLASEELYTANEMMEAIPCDIIEISEDELEEQRQSDEHPDWAGEAEQTGQGGLDEGGAPTEDAVQAIQDADDIDTQAGFSYPAPYTTYETMADYRSFPYRAVGKLFFRRDGRSYVCSASSIGNNAIWTAGHCLHSGNGQADGWATDVVFVPAYKDGNAPFGQWPVRQSTVRTSWYRNGIPNGLCEDMGGAALHTKNGRKISEVVGWLGFAWNWPRIQHWHAMGYPAASPFNGERMFITASSYGYDGILNCSPQSVAIGSNQTGGCSGGPWVWKFGSGNFVMGNNSYRLGDRPEEMKSPYFGDAAKSLKDFLVSM